MKATLPNAMPWLGAMVAILPATFVAFSQDEMGGAKPGTTQENPAPATQQNPAQQNPAPKASEPKASEPKAAESTAPRARLDSAAIDAMFEAAWQEKGLKASGAADDSEWLRRASLLLNGTIPSLEEATTFLADRAENKRTKKIDELIARPAFGEHFGGEWTMALVGRGPRNQRFDRPAFQNWVEEQFNKNTPFNQFTKSIITATGTPEQNPAVGYIERYEAKPKDLAGQTAKAFLGVQIQCAQCHDHKDQQWKQTEFTEFSAYFANTSSRQVSNKGEGRPVYEVFDEPERKQGKMFRDTERRRLEQRAKNAPNPAAAERIKERNEKGELKLTTPVALRPLGEGPFAVSPSGAAFATPSESNNYENDGETAVSATRRERLAAWMTQPDNPYFARSIVNTTFAQLFGYGLVNPVNDFRSDSHVAIPPMLDALANEFIASGYDFKSLVGTLTKTRAFQLSSAGDSKEKSEVREANEKMFARFVTRPMSPTQLFDSIARATGTDEVAEARIREFNGNKKLKGKKAEDPMMGEEAAKRVGQRREGLLRKFVTVFEDDEQAEDIDFEGTIPQALMMMNNKIFNEAISRGLTVTRAAASKEKNVELLYLAVLSRKPSADERAKTASYMQRLGEKRETYEDILWALLNSAEFSTVH